MKKNKYIEFLYCPYCEFKINLTYTSSPLYDLTHEQSLLCSNCDKIVHPYTSTIECTHT